MKAGLTCRRKLGVVLRQVVELAGGDGCAAEVEGSCARICCEAEAGMVHDRLPLLPASVGVQPDSSPRHQDT